MKTIMKNTSLILNSFLQATGVALYIVLVSLIVNNAQKIFGKMDTFFGPVAFLLLFVLSATITGGLTLGRSVILYLENRKTEAVKLFLYTVGWLFVLTVIAFIIQLLI